MCDLACTARATFPRRECRSSSKSMRIRSLWSNTRLACEERASLTPYSSKGLRCAGCWVTCSVLYLPDTSVFNVRILSPSLSFMLPPSRLIARSLPACLPAFLSPLSRSLSRHTHHTRAHTQTRHMHRRTHTHTNTCHIHKRIRTYHPVKVWIGIIATEKLVR